MARHAKKIYDKAWLGKGSSFQHKDGEKDWTYEERTQRFAGVVETADNTKRKNREDSDSIWVDSKRSTADIVTEGDGDEHRNELDTGEDDGNEEGVAVTRKLDCLRELAVSYWRVVAMEGEGKESETMIKLTEVGSVSVEDRETIDKRSKWFGIKR